LGPAYDFSALWPSKISYRTGGWITAGIGVLIMPWKLLETTQGYIFTWLVGYGALLGPIAGILIVDYWLVRKTQLAVDDLYAQGRRLRLSRRLESCGGRGPGAWRAAEPAGVPGGRRAAPV
jgi:cytosine/uracil/thiamine/allantoin permease